MKKILSAFLSVSSFAVLAEVQVVNCSALGNFADYKKGKFGTKKIETNTLSVCPGIMPRVKINRDGTPFTANCGYLLSPEAGYSFSVETQESTSNEIKVRILIAQAKNHKAKDYKELFATTLNQENTNFTRNLETDILAFKESKRKFTKLESIEVSCELRIPDPNDKQKQVNDTDRNLNKDVKLKEEKVYPHDSSTVIQD